MLNGYKAVNAVEFLAVGSMVTLDLTVILGMPNLGMAMLNT